MDKTLKKLRQKLTHTSHIIGKQRKYRNASVLIPMIEIDKEPHVLFQVRADHIRQGGEISFPGGMIEPVDQGDYERTAVRETIEELGIKAKQIDVIGYVGTYVAGFDITIDVYAGLLKVEDLNGFILSEEVASVFTVPLKALQKYSPEIHYIHMDVRQEFTDEAGNKDTGIDAKSLGLPERYQNNHYTNKRRLYFYRHKTHVIWGMTGEILYEFLELLKEEDM